MEHKKSVEQKSTDHSHDDIAAAQLDVEASRMRLDRAFDAIESRIHGTGDRIQTINDQVISRFVSIQENPIPAAIACLLIGYAIGRRVNARYGRPQGVVVEETVLVETPLTSPSAGHVTPSVDQIARQA